MRNSQNPTEDDTNAQLNPSHRGTTNDAQSQEHQQLLESREDLQKPKSLVKEWIGLAVIILIALGNQWQRYILAYANGEGNKRNDPTIEIATAYKEQWKDYYGVISGPAFTITFAIFGIFGGVTADQFNRKMIIIVCSIGWSVCTLLSGIINSFWIFLLMRVLLGIFQAFLNPAAYSVIADYFPQDKRTRANSFYNLAIYFGGAMASLSQIIISTKGWRLCYVVVAIIGLASSAFGVFTIFNPPRGRWEQKKVENKGNMIQTVQQRTTLDKFVASMKEIFQSETSRYVALGGFFRFFGGLSIAYFMPRYFTAIWSPDNSDESLAYKNAYAICNAFVVSVFGFASATIGGFVGDIFETKGILMTKAYICVFSGIFGSVFFALCSLIQIKSAFGFGFAISMLALEYLCAENWIAPAITMLINTISAENKSFAVSAFLFFCQIGGTLATVIAQPLFNAFDIQNNPQYSGYILCVLVLISYLGSIPFFYLAGLKYTEFKKKEAEEKQREQNSGF